MCDEQTGPWLQSAPIRNLAPGADQRIITAVLAADRRRGRRWWSQNIPLWQAVAACAAVFLLTLAIARSRSSGAGFSPGPPTVDTALVENHGADVPPYRTDITEWRILLVKDHRGQ